MSKLYGWSINLLYIITWRNFVRQSIRNLTIANEKKNITIMKFYNLSGKKTKEKVKEEFKSVWLPGEGTELAKITPYVYIWNIWW